jgi:hypothetical protein
LFYNLYNPGQVLEGEKIGFPPWRRKTEAAKRKVRLEEKGRVLDQRGWRLAGWGGQRRTDAALEVSPPTPVCRLKYIPAIYIGVHGRYMESKYG